MNYRKFMLARTTVLAPRRQCLRSFARIHHTPRGGSVDKRVQVEADWIDKNGVVVQMLVHEVESRPVEKENSASVTTFEVLVLPSMPEKGWSNLP
jgi:hypothetical protein